MLCISFCVFKFANTKRVITITSSRTIRIHNSSQHIVRGFSKRGAHRPSSCVQEVFEMRMYRMLIVVAATLRSAGTAVARHRSSPALPAVDVEGVIKSISSAQIVVTIGGHHDVSVAITADTIFRKGDLAIAPAVLKVGDRVEVKAVMKDNVLTAALIKLESAENQHPELVEINGVIKSVSPAELVVTDAQLHDVTVKITADTVIRKGDHIAT